MAYGRFFMDYIVPTNLHYSVIVMTHLNRLPLSILTVIWLTLVLLTLASYCLGETGQAGNNIIYILLIITMIKSQLVANYFMDLRSASLIWRVIMLFYFLIIGSLIALAYSIGKT